MATGTLSAVGQHDWLQVSLTADQAYLVTLDGLSDYAGLEIGTAAALDEGVFAIATPPTAGATPRTETAFFTPDASGTYYIDVSDPATIGGYTVSVDTVSTDYTDNASRPGTVAVACFAAGTHVRTPDGEAEVQLLEKERLIVTASSAVRRIVWIGHRRIDCRRHPHPELVWPVRIRAHAFGPDRPHRDLLLSPDHAVFAEGVLIPVKHLINGTTILQEQVASVHYFHIELDRHDILLAEGLAVESYLDTGNRAQFANGAAHVALHPNFAPRSLSEDSCAPLCVAGPQVQRVRERLRARAERPAQLRRAEAELRVMAGDRFIRPARTTGACHSYLLPQGSRSVRLVSYAAAPDGAAGERRRLGVRIGGIVVNGRTVPLDSPALGEGFHAPEADGRWTDGAAHLSLHATGPIVLEVLVADGMRRRAGTAAAGRARSAA